MEVQMPEMGGFAATAKIRELEQKTGRHLPIIAMTAHAMKGDRDRCLDAGMDGYVAKPIQAKAILAAIEEAVASSRATYDRPPRHKQASKVIDRAALWARCDD